MRVLIRADATIAIGTGHIMRCAALGLRLKESGCTIHFACAALPTGLKEWLVVRGIHVHMISNPMPSDVGNDLRQSVNLARLIGFVDLLVVDHYGLGRDWEQGMRPFVRRILIIDDLADRDHECDMLLDQNLRRDASTRYRNRISPEARQFLGPRFALLRQEFDNDALMRTRDGTVNHLLVFFGGTDPGNQSLKVIDALRLLANSDVQTKLVLGPAHCDRDSVHAKAVGLKGLTVLDTTDRMSLLMAEADLAIGTCGVAAWERCSVGLPSIVVVTADNQREDAELLHAMGAIENLGDVDDVSGYRFASVLNDLLVDAARVREMGTRSASVVAGRSKAIAQLVEELLDGAD